MASFTEEDQALVGELVVTCAGLEHLAVIGLAISMSTTFTAMNATFQKVDVAFKGIGHDAILSTVKRLAPTFLPESDLLDRWKRWIETSRDIGKRRNDVVHTMWSTVGPDELHGISRAPFREVRMPRADMEKLIQDATGAFKDGLFLILDLVKSLREKE
jgi:hypothetical protein